MRAIPFSLLLICVSTSYFVLRATTSLGDVPPLPVLAVFIGGLGVCILIVVLCVRIDRRWNKSPQPPYFVMDTTHGRCLELAADGSYDSCRDFLSTLESHFQAEYSEHMDAGPRPHSDKDKGYWKVNMFDQDFFVMRHRGYGLCIWGPGPPADVSGLLRIAEHFEAVEFVTWQQRIAHMLHFHQRRSSTELAK
jgi:hypothetical protein